MAKGHVGRPTNEEVAARKRKQIIKVMIPVLIIGVVTAMVLTKTGLRGLMGNATRICEPCEEGWQEGDGDTCYQETSQTSQTSAYLLGDADNNGIVEPLDFETVSTAIQTITSEGVNNTTVELDERQKVVYDINKDQVIDENDLVAFNEYFSTIGTGGKTLSENYQVSYVCPREEVEQKTDENNQTITTTTTYEQDSVNEQICNVTTTVRTTRDKVCEEVEETNTVDQDTEAPVEETIETPTESESDITEETCPEPGMEKVYSSALKTYMCSPKDIKPIINSEDADYQVEEEENDNTAEETSITTGDEQETEEEEESEEYGYIKQDSKYLKYGEESGTNDIVIYTKNSVTGAAINADYKYTVFADSQCSGGQNTSGGISTQYNNYSTEIIQVMDGGLDVKKYATAKKTIEYKMFKSLRINGKTVEQILNAGGKATLYVRQYIDSNEYEQGTVNNKSCVPITIEKDKETAVTFENKPKANKGSTATVVVAFNKKFENRGSQAALYDNKKIVVSKAGNSVLGIPNNSKYYKGFKGSNSTKKVKKYYKLKGWVISKKVSGQIYSYCKNAQGKKEWKKGSSCPNGYGAVVVGSDVSPKTLKYGDNEELTNVRNVVKLNDYITDSGEYTFKAEWKAQNYDLKLYNAKIKDSKKKKVKRYIKVQLYDNAACTGKAILTKTQKPLYQGKESAKGVVAIPSPNYNNTSGTNKTYYLKITPSHYYDAYNKCDPVTPGRKVIKINLQPKKFNITYEPNGGKKKDMEKTPKYTDVATTLKKNQFTRKNYKFDFWTVTRKVKGKTEHRCYTNKTKKKAKWQNKKCESGLTKHYKDHTSINVNTPEGNLHMHAHWKKK